MGAEGARRSMGTKGARRKILSTLHPNTILRPNPEETIGRAFSPTAGRMCGWCPRGHRAQRAGCVDGARAVTGLRGVE